MIASCPNQDRLRDFSLGRLNEEQSDLIFTHLSDCQDCQSTLSETDQQDSLLGDIKESRLKGESYSEESECKVALTRALATLADVKSSSELPEQKLPQQIGDYEFLQMIGRGGMGNVYLARHTKLGNEVALKIIAAHRASEPGIRGRFESELLALGKLDHPNIVQAKDAREADGVILLVTEFIDGLDLGEIVKRCGPLSVPDACFIVKKVCSALTEIDKAGLVHRDIKPSNVMINRQGQVKLLDLGLAKLQSDQGQREFTMTGQAIGTVDYLAPEQIQGEEGIDIRADIYGLGCTLYKLLTTSVPFAAPDYSSTFSKMTAHVSAERPVLDSKSVPNGVCTLAKKMMSVDPVDRPDTPAKVARSIERFADCADLQSLVSTALKTNGTHWAESSLADQKPDAEPLPWWRRRIPVFTSIAAGLGGMILGLLFGIIITIKHPDGSITKMEVPNGSSVAIDENGNAEVKLNSEQDTGSVNSSPVPHASLNPNSATSDGLTPAKEPMEGLGDSPAIGHSQKIDGIWEMKLQRRSRDKVSNWETGPTSGPSVIVFHQNTFAIFDKHRMLATGISDRMLDSTGRLQLELDIERIESVGASNEVRAFPNRSRFSPRFIEDDTLNLNMVGSPIAGGGDEYEFRLQLSRAELNKSIQQYREAIEQSAFRKIHGEYLLAMKWLYEKQFDSFELPADFVQETAVATSQRNLRYLAIGILNYHDAIKRLPATQNSFAKGNMDLGAGGGAGGGSMIYDSGGSGGLGDSAEPKSFPFSWRVAVLPYIDHLDLYKQYKFNEPWNSPDNLKLQRKMPAIFRHPMDPEMTTKTRYQGFCGIGFSEGRTTFGKTRSGRLEEIVDGTSQTIMLAEAANPVIWTQPQDIEFDSTNPSAILDMLIKPKCNVTLADGSTHQIHIKDDTASLEALRDMITTDDGNMVQPGSNPLFDRDPE